VAIASGERIRLHELASGAEKPLGGSLPPSGGSMLLSPDGGTLATIGGWDPAVRLWDTASGRELHPSAGHGGFGGLLAFTPDGRTLAVAGGSSRSGVRLWDLAGVKLRGILGESDPATTLIALSADGQTVLTRSKEVLTLWDLASRSQKRSVTAGSGTYTTVAATPHAETVVTVNQGARVWDGATLGQRGTLEGVKPNVYNVSLSADGKRLAVGDYQGGGGGGGPGQSRIRLWDVATGKEMTTQLPPMRGTLNIVALSPDGKLVAGATGEHLKLWEIATGAERVVFQDQGKFPYYHMRFSPQVDTLVCWSTQQFKLFDTATGRERGPLKGHSDNCALAGYNQNGTLLATADRSGLLIVWNTATAAEVHRLQLPGPVGNLTFAADGRHLATANANGTVYILRLR
jgi:WD40 repeat protein